MSEAAKEYSNGEITIHWDATKCTHSGRCVAGLPAVFNPKERPWIKPLNATTDELTRQVDRCPSGALTWTKNE